MVERVYGLGYNVLVSFRRGRLRLLLGPSSVSCVVRVVVLLLVDVSELLEVVDEPSDGLMSVVTGGLVLLTVSVVVAVVVDEVRDELDPPGSM
ncbi:hypothetical protein [Mycobacterium sp. URHB0044]|uniref:hypothetical protein n=1 Tax=Mycobacterium sp. URHB0044 TaxID=1380386 RepID=UPI00048FAE25|nr:hypothetical protein [Mycobacterium sp. URHB0044]